MPISLAFYVKWENKDSAIKSQVYLCALKLKNYNFVMAKHTSFVVRLNINCSDFWVLSGSIFCIASTHSWFLLIHPQLEKYELTPLYVSLEKLYSCMLNCSWAIVVYNQNGRDYFFCLKIAQTYTEKCCMFYVIFGWGDLHSSFLLLSSYFLFKLWHCN